VLRHPRDRRRFVVARAALRLVLGAALDADPRALVVRQSCVHCGGPHGPLALPDAPWLHASSSRSGALALLALAGAPVGTDVERLSRAPVEVLPLLAPEEREAVLEVPPHARGEAFLHVWTRKEAIFKLGGRGAKDVLHVPLGSAAARPRAATVGGHHVHTLVERGRLVATVAMDAPVPSFALRRADALLDRWSARR
jgi:4'-phosphopantetheinyl transferase